MVKAGLSRRRRPTVKTRGSLGGSSQAAVTASWRKVSTAKTRQLEVLSAPPSGSLTKSESAGYPVLASGFAPLARVTAAANVDRVTSLFEGRYP